MKLKFYLELNSDFFPIWENVMNPLPKLMILILSSVPPILSLLHGIQMRHVMETPMRQNFGRVVRSMNAAESISNRSFIISMPTITLIPMDISTI